MKKKIIIGLATLVAIIGISLLTFKPKPVQGAWCSWGFRSTSSWPGQCVSCACQDWVYTGKISGCPPVEPQ